MPDNTVTGLPAVISDVAVRRQLWGWCAVAVGALAIAGAFALLLAVSRIPDIEAVAFWPLDFFYKGLVIHVVFSFVVWFLASFAALAVIARERLAPGHHSLDSIGLAAMLGAVLALPLLFVPAFLDRGQPTLNNYVPVIIDPLYYGGLALLALCIGLVATRLLVATTPKALRRNPLDATIAAAALACLLALLCFALAHQRLAAAPWSFDVNEALMWGGGHILQFVNVLILLVAWSWLAAPWLQGSVPALALAVASGVLLAGAVAGPVFYALFPPFSAEQTRAFTWLQYLLGPSAAILAIPLLARLVRPLPWREPAVLALMLSMLLFAVGGVLGLFVDGADTRTPAHYHGVIAGVTLALFGLFFTRLLPMLGRRAGPPRRQRLILHLFAWGQLCACIGLFIAGGHGAPRKVAGEAQGLADVAAMIGMGMNGLGGLVAVIGGVLFVWTVGLALMRAANAENPATTNALPI